MNSKKRYESGLTLIELTIAMAISIVVMAAIYKAYQSQQKASKALELTGPEIDEINRLAERPGWWDTEENMLKAQAIFQQARIRKLSSFGAALEAVTPAQQKDPYQEYLELDAKLKAAENAGGK